MRFLFLAPVLICLTSPAFAGIQIKDAHAYETSEGMKNGAVVFSIVNDGDGADKLVSASTPAADAAQIHEMSNDRGIMKMRQVDGVEIGPEETLIFSPDGYHLMLMGLQKPLVAGAKIPLTLQFEKAGKIDTDFKVESLAAKPAKSGDAMSGMDMGKDAQ